MRSNIVVLALSLLVLCVSSVIAMTSMGLDASNPAYSDLMDTPSEGIMKFTDFDNLYNNYFEKPGTLVVDARSFSQSLVCVPGSYNVPASIFQHHAKIFPANRNYFVYGSNYDIVFVANHLIKRGAEVVHVIEVMDFDTEWKWKPQVKPFPYYEVISQAEMYSRYMNGKPQDKNPIIVDVRNPSEFAIKHIKHAINVPMAKLKESFDTVLPVTQKVYLYGMDEQAGIEAAKIFAAEYRAYTMPIAGGLRAWVANGYPTEGLSKEPKTFEDLVASLGF